MLLTYDVYCTIGSTALAQNVAVYYHHIICICITTHIIPYHVLYRKTGGDKICDHLHDGTGFATSHMALTLMFERAVQAVDPSIAVPYWDFTIVSTVCMYILPGTQQALTFVLRSPSDRSVVGRQDKT